jgi:hypothetical protein
MTSAMQSMCSRAAKYAAAMTRSVLFCVCCGLMDENVVVSNPDHETPGGGRIAPKRGKHAVGHIVVMAKRG